MTIFLIADTHFHHRKIIEFEAVNRPFLTIEEHDEELVRRWNETVCQQDKVYVLGDFAFGHKNKAAIAFRLNGRKTLIGGNHDLFDTSEYLKHFKNVRGCRVIDKVVLTHIPVHPGQFARFRLNVHGHLHSSALDDPRYVCVSAEMTGLRPVAWDDVVKERIYE